MVHPELTSEDVRLCAARAKFATRAGDVFSFRQREWLASCDAARDMTNRSIDA